MARPSIALNLAVSLFHSPISSVTYDDVLAFCRAFTEGVRVEYKREPANIPKLISSFANTVGGVWIIGVDADKKTNAAKLPPAGIDGNGLEERIVQAAQTGIYPPITPAVRVFPIPNSSRVVAVVKVDESIEAPHAIENRTRVYVRTESISDPYDLSDIDRIDYLLRRRQQPEERREQIVTDMMMRSRFDGTRARIIVAPVYPRGILLPMDDLVERIETIMSLPGRRLSLDERRVIQSGVLSSGIDPAKPSLHFEADVHGVVFFEAPTRVNGHLKDIDTGRQIPFVLLYTLMVTPATVIDFAIALLRGYVTNVLIRYELLEWTGIGFVHADPSTFIEPGTVAKTQSCIQPRVVASVSTMLEGLADRRVAVLAELARQTLWAFNYRSDSLPAEVRAALHAAQVL